MIRISVVVPVYQGELTLLSLLGELAAYSESALSPRGQNFRVAEVILVNDGAIDDSTRIMHELAEQYSFLTLIWLSRNFGQHPATLAGMAASTGDWVVTLDEDGQYDPADIGSMLDLAFDRNAQLVYAMPTNLAPHAAWRNLTSRLVKVASRMLVGKDLSGGFYSFRLVRGEIARSLAAYCGQGVYLDVALSWVVGRQAFCPVVFRPEQGRRSGYSLQRLLSHFWRLVLSAGTRPLRIIAVVGVASILLALGLSAHAVWAKIAYQVPIQGWTSLFTAVCLFSGLILFALGVIAEYLALTLTMAMGRPLYLTVRPPSRSRDNVS